jgi:ribonuclease-3
LSIIPSLVFNERTVVFCELAENDRNVTPLEERIGYKFRNSLLLAEALTHPSVGHEAQRYHFDYQRLEFLGDAVLQLVITEYLFRNFRIEAEGQLTKLRSRLVSREALRMHAAALDLGRYILMGRGEESSGGRERTSTLADAFEALIGALYLDGGLDVAKEFILTQTRADLDELAEKPVDINPKGDLQELLQSISPQSPVYELISQTGPEHEKTFVSQVVWEGIVLGQGSGRSKKQAETAAAIEAMQLRRWEKKRENETA